MMFMAMDKVVHQIWVGGELPERERGWVAGVRAAAVAAGWEHRLWGWEELQAAFGTEPVAEVFLQLMDVFPQAVTYSLAADYYRLRVLAEGGGVYLDADFECSGGWPEFSETADVLLLREFFCGRACNGFFLCRTPEAMRVAARMAEERLLELLPPDAADLPTRFVQLVRRDEGRGSLVFRGIGGGWLRREVQPRWAEMGLRGEFVPPHQVGHRQWKGVSSRLTHMAAAHWHAGGRDVEYWSGMARRAGALSAGRRSRALAVRCEVLPEHLRPVGGCMRPVAPQPRRRREDGGAVGRSVAGLCIPRGTRRVVVLSNVTEGFSPEMLPLRAGDLVLHCNHARHMSEAMAVPGTRHWLFVRHGKGNSPRGWHWYHDGSFDGFEKVFFVDDAVLVRPFRWYAEFRRRSKLSPTTGFVVANLMREIAPRLPLVLAGFDPGVPRGTPLWAGHDWAVERAWYAERGFRLYRPRRKARVLVLITSCLGYVNREVRRKDAAAVYAQRRACRLGWLRHGMAASVDAFFVVGRGECAEELLVRQVDAEDDYWHLPEKVRAAMRLALAEYDFDWLVKCDDDTFMHLPRLEAFVAGLPVGTRDIYGAATADGREDCLCGGGGYVLHREMVELVANDPRFPVKGREDLEVCRSVLRHGGKVVVDERFCATDAVVPSRENQAISCHYVTPQRMRSLQEENFNHE